MTARLPGPGHSLRIFNPLKLSSTGFIMDVSTTAKGWKRSIRRNGGYHRGQFTLVDDTPDHSKSAALANFFYQNLGTHFEERAGGQVTWEGMIYEMDLAIGGVVRRVSLEKLYDHVMVKYTDENGKPKNGTPVYNQKSIDRYGRREEIIPLDGFPTASAEGAQATFLKENSWPWARGVGNNITKEPTLTIRPCGYSFTANWRFSSITGGLTNLSDFIKAIVPADFEFLNLGSVDTNTFQVKQTQNIPQRCWDLILFLLELGDSTENIYRAYVDNNRRFNYKQIDPTFVEYYLRGGKFYNSAGGSQEVNYWQFHPGVCRDMDSPISKSQYNPWFADGRDFYLDEVEFGDDMETPTWKTAYFEESGILAAQAAYQRQLEQERARKRKS